jgi:hypothetical protein
MPSLIKVCGREIRVKGKFLRIARLDADKYKFLDDPVTLIDGLRACGTRIDIFTFLQKLPDSVPAYSYPMEMDNLAVIPISTFENWWANQIRFKARNKAKQAAKKGVILREVPFDDALVRGIWELYNECPVRQGRRFTHFGKALDTVRREEATFLDSCTFVGAFFEEKLIGFIKLVYDESNKQAGLMNIISMIRHRDKAPTNALVAEAVRVCADRNVSFLVYSNFAYGNKLKDSVIDFKESCGFQRFDLPRYFVPLTSVGKLAFQSGFHKDLVDRVPESVLAKVRSIRNSWNNRKMHASPETS